MQIYRAYILRCDNLLEIFLLNLIALADGLLEERLKSLNRCLVKARLRPIICDVGDALDDRCGRHGVAALGVDEPVELVDDLCAWRNVNWFLMMSKRGESSRAVLYYVRDIDIIN